MSETNIPYDFCLLIPHYNNPDRLMQSLKSVNYSQGNFFVLIVDDGSMDKIDESRLESLFAVGTFKIIYLHQNQGITVALNKGLSWIKDHLQVQYIARLDCGDICHPERFIKQVNYLKHHTNMFLLGTWCRFTNYANGLSYTYKTPVTHAAILKQMHTRNVFIHPAIMFRKKIIDDGIFYPTTYPHAEDYAFCWSILNNYKVAVLGEVLMTCEITRSGISLQNRGKQLHSRMRIIATFASNFRLKIFGMLRLMMVSLIPASILNKMKF